MIDPVTEALGNERAARLAKMPFHKRLWTLLCEVFPPYGHSSADTFLGVPIYGRRREDYSRAFNVLMDAGLTTRRHLNEAYYWCYYRIRRYDLIRTDLGFDYADVDRRMFLACFALLGEFVEQELGKVEDNADPDNGHRGYRLHRADDSDGTNPERTAIDLWLWYLAEKARDFEPDESDPAGMQSEDLYDRRLRDLIDIRRSLWT